MASMIAQEESAVNLTEASMYRVSSFSLAAFRTVSFSLMFDSGYDVSKCEFQTLSYLKFVNLFGCTE